MTDPISPTGSPGQLPLIVPGSPSPPPVFAGEGASVPETAGAAQASHHEESVQLELSDLAKQAVSNRAKDAPKAEVGLADAIKTMREYIKNLPSDLQFTTDNDSGYVICRVINPVTREVIRQYPPEELIEMARRLRALGDSGSKSGALLDKEL